MPPTAPDLLHAVVADVLHPRHFFVGAGAALEWHGPAREDVPWELFQGRLLEPAQTRQRRTLLTWGVYWRDETGRSAEPLLSVRLDEAEGRLHVVRAVLSHVWEGYDAGGGVYRSRETTRWVRELVGTIPLDRVAGAEELRGELAGLVGRAVVGTSRLPLTSVESPLPAFSLGRLACVRQPAGEAGPLTSWEELLARGLDGTRPGDEEARALEAALRAMPAEGPAEAARLLAERRAARRPTEVLGLLRTLFNQVALSPWTGFAERALGLVRALVEQGLLAPAGEADFLTWLLRQLGRHLTAYDLVTFHHRGANYPDALLLDLALKRCLSLAEADPALFLPDGADDAARRLRRRGLRQGWLLRRRYEGHPVPDAPTSPGESARVLPPPHVRVPEEQILQPARRRRRLFAGDPLEGYLGGRARAVLGAAAGDLGHPDELRELGLAVFIDRPLGAFKQPLEPDGTLLLSHEAFSRSVAAARLRELAGRLGLLARAEGERLAGVLAALPVPGLPLSAVQCEERRIVSLADARRAAEDFVLLRTTRRAVADFLAQYDLGGLAARFDLAFLTRDRGALIVPDPAGPGDAGRVLAVYDLGLRRRLELEFRREQGYEARVGREHPRGGLRVLRAWGPGQGEAAREGTDLRGEGVALRPADRSP